MTMEGLYAYTAKRKDVIGFSLLVVDGIKFRRLGLFMCAQARKIWMVEGMDFEKLKSLCGTTPPPVRETSGGAINTDLCRGLQDR